MPNKARSTAKSDNELPKADMVHRGVGRLVDFIIALLLARLLPPGVGAVVAVSYILLADGVLGGQSPGKRLAGLKVVSRRNRSDAEFRESIVRNLPFAVVTAFWYIPILGFILFPLGGLFVLTFEFYMAWSDRLGLRIGDILAETQVVDGSVPIESKVASSRASSGRRSRPRADAPPEPEGAG